MIAIGVARPSAHGHAMMSTATALTSASASFGSGPHTLHATKATTDVATTAGTKYSAIRSASRWMGARVRCASLTMRTICASRVSLPTRSARIVNEPVPLIVAPVTALPASLSTGIASPVTIDSSTVLRPSTTTPSTGIFSPGRTRMRSPTCTSASGTSRSSPSRTRRAVFGARPSSALIAAVVRLRARISSICPSSTSTVIIIAVSKYGSTTPPMRKPTGKMPGATVATTL